jgi:hypothetical protein
MRARSWMILIAAGIGVALLITLFSPLASGNPDGLERVAEDKEFIDQAREPGYSLIPDYTFPGVDNEALATILSGVVGVLIVAAISFGAGFGLRAVARSRADTDGDAGGSAPVASQGQGGD